jgi:hypothetical protein
VNKRTKFLLGIGVIAALIFGLQIAAYAHAEVSLPGSNFEIEDPAVLPGANLKVDDAAPSIDWASVTETRKPDKASGTGDDSFGQGAKEDSPVPSVVSGSIPPNKSDLKTFGVYLETNAAGRFLNLYWNRVQDPTGTTNMDFEFNQSSTTSANGVTPVRTAGDVLIQYDLANGGTNPELFLSRWITTGAGSLCEASNATPCWSDRVNLSAAGDATGSINTAAIPNAESDGLGAMSARTFGEAQIDFDALTGGAGSCTSFGSAYLKSRSSDSFTAALKDFIAPSSLNLPNCGGVTIRKQTIPDEDPNTTSFGYTKSITTNPVTPNTFSLTDDGVKTFTNVVQGNGYTVNEDVIPAGWAFTSVDCSASTGVTVDTSAAPLITFNIDAATDNVDCTYTNTRQLGAILVTKTAKHAASGPGDHAQAGVDFTVDGVTKTTNSLGQACFDGLSFGSHDVTETLPAGYVADGPLTKAVNVDNNATCAATPYAGETVSFSNTPLTDLDVSVTSQVTGGTASTINCDDPDSSSSGAFAENPTLAVNDLEPGTYTCIVVIDP